MRFRLRLALAFLLLSALPLTLLALYSFTSSSTALRAAAESEAQVMARELEQRVGWAATEINQRVRAFARLPAASWLREPNEASAPRGEAQAFADLAKALPYLEDFRFVPKAPGAPQPAAKPAPGPAPHAQAAIAPPGPPSAAELDRILRLASQQSALALTQLPEHLSEAERTRIRVQIEKTRRDIAKTLAEREQIRATRLAPPAVPAIAPPAAVAETPPVPAVAPVAPTPAAEPAPALEEAVSCSVSEDGQVVGELQGRLKAKELLRSVLSQAHREQGEIPFAIDGDKQLYVANDEDGEVLKQLPAVAALRGVELSAEATEAARDWVVVTRSDAATGMRFGIARPLSRTLAELKRATARNFASGLALVALATVAMVPLSSGLIKNVRRLEEGATRIAGGDLSTRLPVTSRDEFGRLAATFNHMAEQLAEHQERLLEQERRQKEQELERRLLAVENERRGRELEEARRFQLSLLPRQLPQRPGLELAVAMSTATEVGGDYYDFRESANGELLIAIGDATGHGAAAGTMVTVVKSLFMSAADETTPAAFLRRATGLVHGMGLSRMAMALAVARLAGNRLIYSSAGMPPALHFVAATGEVQELALPGMPLGSRADFVYSELPLELAQGDALLLMSDGFPELPNAAGEPLGYERARTSFADCATRPASDIVTHLEAVAANWLGVCESCDDVTFLVLKRLA